MTLIVTGGAGFVGSHLCERLLKEGHKVICMDNLYTGQLASISHLTKYSGFEFVHHDITVPFSMKGIDGIYNLACPASPRHYQEDPVFTTLTSVVGTRNMLELAKANSCPILQASTSEVYGNPEVHPQTENYLGNVSCTGVRSCYDEGKRCAESICMDYHRLYGVEVKLIRIFNTYGPRMAENDGRVISNFITQALRGEDITVYGDGNQTRSFMYVDDLIKGMKRIMATDSAFTGPVNLGNPEERKINELAELVIRFTDSPSKIVHENLPQDDPHRRRPDITLARTALGWRPEVTLNEGLIRTIEYFAKNNSNKTSCCALYENRIIEKRIS